jgi:hypothetical protein
MILSLLLLFSVVSGVSAAKARVVINWIEEI